jgi:phosphoribosylformylglycinamidine cyclo-ligase
MSSKPLTYADAGVDLDRAGAFIDRITPLAQTTHRPGVLGGLGGFGGLFQLGRGWKDPVLVSGTDGVGTKLAVAIAAGRHYGIGIDLVAMCVNDILCHGAEPLFFLDYFASGRLNVEVAAQVVAGIAQGCREAGCALIGGETAELPGVFTGNGYEVAGFALGAVERDRLIDGRQVMTGDVVVGLASNGLHANGFSLARKAVFEVLQRDPAGPAFGDFPDLAAEMLAPTRIYVRPVLDLLAVQPVHAIAHITGGGLVDNVPRMLPTGRRAVLDRANWPEPPIFGAIRSAGVPETELQRVFNLGIGLVLVVPPEHAGATLERLTASGERAWAIGSIESGDRGCALVGPQAS